MFIRIIVSVLAFAFLGGCEKAKEFETVKSELAETKAQISQMNVELTATKARVTALEEKQVSVTPAVPAPPPQTSTGPTREQIAQLNKTIHICVDVVHNTKPPEGDPLANMTAQFYARFDAFYNSNTGRVQNNVMVNGEMSALYVFNKCMADRGIPLN